MTITLLSQLFAATLHLIACILPTSWSPNTFLNGRFFLDPQSPKIDLIETWARTNNMTLNRTKSTDIIFVVTRRKRQVAACPPLPGILRVTLLKVLSASDHVRAHRLYALTVLRANGMCDSALQIVFRSVVVAELLHACSAWWGIGDSSMRQTGSASMRSCGEVFVAAAVRTTYLRSKNCARLLTGSCSPRF
jgi:hypothetical protein